MSDAMASRPPLITSPPPSRGPISINNLLRSLTPASLVPPQVHAEDIAFAMSNIFTNQLSPVQTAILLYSLSITGLEQRPDVVAKCAIAMRAAAVPLDLQGLKAKLRKKRRRIGNYHGGMCDIVGTGGDFHSTFNISTTSSILCSSLLHIAKHGNRAATSKSGSADVLQAMKVAHPTTPSETISPKLEAVGPDALQTIYDRTNYAFLFAPNFHKGLRHVAGIRRELPGPSILNLLGPLTNPAESALEARIIGVKKKDLVPVFAEAMRLNGVRKAIVVCGDEDLDEISIAGPTHCARLVDSRGGEERNVGGNDDGEGPHEPTVKVERFTLTPEDFGIPRHALSEVAPGGSPQENAQILTRLLKGELEDDNPILHFVLINAAALFVVSGICEGKTSAFEEFGDKEPCIPERGVQGGRWKEGVRLARMAIRSGRALEMFNGFTTVTNGL